LKPLLYQLSYGKFSINKLYSKLRIPLFIQLVMLISSPLLVSGQGTDNDSLTTIIDSLHRGDTTAVSDSITTNSIVSKDALESKVTYRAKDSTRFDLVNQKLYLFGNAEVHYDQIVLKAAIIEVNLDSNLVFARGAPDSSGKIVGTPVFKDGDQEFSSTQMTYNFKTKKGKINEVITQEGEGYLHGKDVKKTEGDVIYIRDGKYTTCNLPHPHFSIASRKLKVIPGKKIITGPAVLVIEDVPTPLGIPFGMFPNSNDRSSGILVPAPGESNSQGFFLQNGGYYFGFSDKVDLTIRGDIYSKGSYAFNALSTYRSRYRFNGNVNISRSITRLGVIKEDPSYSESKNFFLNWVHNQDPKARPNSRFSANVNAGTQANFRNNLNTTTSDYLSNTFNSNISYSKTFAGTPLSMSLAARHSQNSNTGIVNLTAPDATFNMQRVYLPGKLKKIGISSTLTAKNEINVHDSLISANNMRELAKDFNYGARNTIPISTSLKFLKYFSFNPSLSSTQLLYYESIQKIWNPEDSSVITRKSPGLQAAANYSHSYNVSTILYGIFQFKGEKIQAIRHKMTPSIGYAVTPKNNSGLRSYTDGSTGEKVDYSIFEDGVYSGLNTREARNVTMSLQNNLEMKVKNNKDSSEATKKIKLLENLSLSTSYNTVADSLNWAPVSIQGRTYIGKNTSLNFGGTVDLYTLDSAGRTINTFHWDKERKLGRLTNGYITLGLNLRSPQGGDKQTESQGPPGSVYQPYIDFDVPWTLNMNYKLDYSKPQFKDEIRQTINFSGDLSLTPKWKIGFTSGYDVDAKDLTYTTVNFYRDLHCWEMSFNWIPIGFRQSYTFTIKVKASVLQDLKLEKRNLPQAQL
jgi:lipopolysaccharide export system protein LptA